MTRKKIRAAALAVAQGLAENEDQAARLIMAGKIFLRLPNPASPPGRVGKPGDLFPPEAPFFLQEPSPYVSRGAYKLLTALESFRIDVRGLVALDAGSSTGGFTDCLIRRGAARVYAADTGKGLLHEKLRGNNRVIPLEGVNLRLADSKLLPEPVDMVTADLSFISLKAVLPVLFCFVKPEGSILALIKPQFEADPGQTVKGVVRSEILRNQAVESVLSFAERLGLCLRGIIPSAIKGAKGNQEYLAWWWKSVHYQPGEKVPYGRSLYDQGISAQRIPKGYR